ncbi:outer membrane protein [Yoonia sp.]|uniref:outer membrane protein n=1 Tax=Yoonia sp. TaxID=2212373 RepID=UPI0023B68807
MSKTHLYTATSMLLAAPAMAETEFAFYLGGQSAPHSVVSGTDPGNATDETPDFTAKWEGRSFEAPIYYGLRVTEWQTETFGWGVEFTHSKVYADTRTRVENGFDTLELTDGVNILTVNANRRWPDLIDGFTPYVNGGIGIGIPRVEVESAGGSTLGYQITGPAVRVTAGVNYAINDTWGVFGEYQNTISYHDMDLGNGGSLQTTLVTNALNVGVSYSY